MQVAPTIPAVFLTISYGKEHWHLQQKGCPGPGKKYTRCPKLYVIQNTHESIKMIQVFKRSQEPS